MIYYFSGTGNSAYVAAQLGSLLGERVVSIMDYGSGVLPDGNAGIGFVFPVYSWGVPPVVTGFINSLPGEFWSDIRERNVRVWCVMTCGDEVALAPEMLGNVLGKKGIAVESIWSVTMPNNYVLLPGFDVDNEETGNRKLRESLSRIKEIAEGIARHEKVCDVVRGSMPWLKTKMVYPLFKKWGIIDKKWHSTDDCVGCGICAAKCPEKNIRIIDGKPVWGHDCCSCLACYHSCPFHAVAYGSATRRKGQYLFPDKQMDGVADND